jgi:error-prone DNA polymerase
VHPYLRRRDGIEPEQYPAPSPAHGPADELRQILGKTKGVPLFQEQAMRIAMDAAKFTGAEVNELRKAMATFRSRGTIGLLEDKMVSAMVGRGYDPQFAARCFNQIKGFGEYGFPESHAASFAHLVYVSSWLKCHYPAAFCCALLNSQPMGFYAPAQLVRDAREHGVGVLPPDINLSAWEATLEPGLEPGDAVDQPLLRLGLGQIDGLAQRDAAAMLTARAQAPFRDVRDLWRRAGVPRASIERIAAADAMRSLGLDRRQALWEVRGLSLAAPLPLFAFAGCDETGLETPVALPAMGLSEHVVNDYQTLRLSLKAHPVSFLRERFAAERAVTCGALAGMKDGAWLAVAGVVLVRQRPGSAKGVVFMTIEDETGVANTVVWPTILERFRTVVMTARLLLVKGRIQRHGSIIHIVAKTIEDRSGWLLDLSPSASDLPIPIANADEVLRPEPGLQRVKHAPGQLRHPRNVRILPAGQPAILPKSRDFH